MAKFLVTKIITLEMLFDIPVLTRKALMERFPYHCSLMKLTVYLLYIFVYRKLECELTVLI